MTWDFSKLRVECFDLGSRSAASPIPAGSSRKPLKEKGRKVRRRQKTARTQCFRAVNGFLGSESGATTCLSVPVIAVNLSTFKSSIQACPGPVETISSRQFTVFPDFSAGSTGISIFALESGPIVAATEDLDRGLALRCCQPKCSAGQVFGSDPSRDPISLAGHGGEILAGSTMGVIQPADSRVLIGFGVRIADDVQGVAT